MDELELLRRAGADVPLVDDEARSKVRSRLTAMIDAETSHGSGPSPTPRRRRRRSLVGVSIAAVAVVIIMVQTLLPPGSSGPDTAEAALQRLSSVAARIPTPTLQVGQFLYVRSVGDIAETDADVAIGKTWSFTVNVIRETWLGSDGSGRIVERLGSPHLDSPKDRSAWLEAGSPPLLPRGHGEDRTFGPGDLSPRDLGVLPRDPSQLAAAISSGGIKTGAGASPGAPLTTIADLLGEVPTSAALRSALFQATAELPGIISLGTVADPIGREGIGVAMVRSGMRTELIFDRQDSSLLAEIVTRTAPSGRASELLALSFDSRAIVSSSSSRPA